MEQEIREFIEYLHNTKKTSQNTEVSYQRDLNKMAAYLEMKGIMKAEDVREFDHGIHGLYGERELRVIYYFKKCCFHACFFSTHVCT